MSRTPSMSIAECEALLGPRGNTFINSENRATARKWLTASGFPALFVAGLSMRELGAAYSDDNDDALQRLRRKLAEMPVEDDSPAPVSLGAAATPPSQDDSLAKVRDLLLAGWQPQTALDPNAVRAIVQEEIAGIAPRIIEVRHQDKAPIRIDGLVHPEFERVVNYLATKGPNGYQTNVLLVGPAGCGKSHLIGQVAKALDTESTIVCGTAGASEGDLIGRLLPTEGGKFEYLPSMAIQLYEKGNATIGFDEIDGFDSNMLMIANMPLANGHWPVHLRHNNPMVKRGERVFFCATANTYGTGANPLYAGRNALDAATLDRFVMITVDYDKRLEESIAAAGGLTAAEMAGIWELRDRCREAQLRRVISTRAFQKAAVMKQCGDSWREIRDRLLEGWSKDEKAKVGV